MTNEELKLEAIKKAYGVHYKANKITGNGWYLANDPNTCKPEQNGFELSNVDILSSLTWRPKSLAGIENSRGWIRIEEDGSNLPKEDGDYWFYTIHAKITKNQYNPCWDITHRKRYIDAYTHYQPIIKPEPPLW